MRRIPVELIVHTDEILGSGRFGTCKKGFMQGTPVCLKYMDCYDQSVEQKLIHREACVLSQLSHPSICFLHGIQVEDDKCTSLVMSLYVIDGVVVTVHDLISFKFDSSNATLVSNSTLLHSIMFIASYSNLDNSLLSDYRWHCLHSWERDNSPRLKG